MQNITGGGHTYTDGVRLAEINGEKLNDIMMQALGSGSGINITVYDVEWRFFINPASILVGGGKFNNPGNLRGIPNWDFSPKCGLGALGCASVAFTVGLIHIDPQYESMKHNIKRSVALGELCWDIQEKCGFENPYEVAIQDFASFVRIYKTFRVVVISSAFLQGQIFEGREFVQNPDPKLCKTIYIYHDINSQHYVRCSSPASLIQSMKQRGLRWKWCYECTSSWNSEKEGSSCLCGQNIGKAQTYKRKTCGGCGEIYPSTSKHRCGYTNCHTCSLFLKRQDFPVHRCLLEVNKKTFMKVFKGDENLLLGAEVQDDDKRTQLELFVWDIESHLVPIPDTYTQAYEVDEDGKFVLHEDAPVSYTIQKCSQIPNFVAWQNVFTGKKYQSYEFRDFIQFALTNNDGYNLFLAHNSSGYDTRLLFEEINRMSTAQKIEPIFRGTRFMRLVVGNTVFQDSMLHLTNSLANLGKSFKLPMEKGHFPHLFNRPENVDYNGPLPGKEFFDLAFSCKTKKDFEEFNEWHDSFTGVWNLRNELEKYCVNDVDMLAKMVLLYHENSIANLKEYPYLTVSPWFFPTLASWVHKLMIRHLHEGFGVEGMTEDERVQYSKTTWVALEGEEFYYAKLALRGGSTNICRYYYEGDIHYKDIQSSYPSVQMDSDNLYPVGAPTIEIHDPDYYPCNICYEKTGSTCHHSLDNKKQFQRLKLDIKQVDVSDLHAYCLDFFGIITVDITPNRELYHPVIQVFDEGRGKVIGSLEPIPRTTLTSVILKRAIEHGYIVTKIYRADRYRAQESIYRNGLLGSLYVSKMKNSGKAPIGEARQVMRNTFMDKFKIDLGDMDCWEKNPVLKAVAKGPPTSAWGKHAETVDHPQAAIMGINEQLNMQFYNSIQDNKRKVSKFQFLGDGNILFNYNESRKMQRPNLHKAYMPVAVFVTAYGRDKLWKELHKLGKRVLMYDTDSVVYSASGEHAYEIPEGDCLGDWETEDFEIDHGGIKKFVAIGPKSYCITGGDGQEYMKLKGACTKYAHEDMINGSVMEDLVLRGDKVKLPQMSFDYRVNSGISIRKFLKAIQFHEKDVKGTYNRQENRAYPFGYKEA
jgi:hypothetical protein